MGDKSKIEWTDATWNPLAGCSRVSPGCDNCYAIPQAHRMAANPNLKINNAYAGTTTEDGKDWTGHMNMLGDRLDQPLRWQRPRRIFVNSMSDLFHPDVPFEFQCQVFTVMAKASALGHQFQILTKRPQLMATFPDRWAPTRPSVFAGNTLRNVWLGTSIESNKYAFRADHLRATPAQVRWLSLEPLLGPLPDLDLTGINWVVVGGESGPGARPMHPAWARDIRDRCIEAGVPFHFKQWGAWLPRDTGPTPEPGDQKSMMLHGAGMTCRTPDNPNHDPWSLGHPGWVALDRVGKRNAGRELDGRTWDEWPA